jgi:hypothetical protein
MLCKRIVVRKMFESYCALNLNERNAAALFNLSVGSDTGTAGCEPLVSHVYPHVDQEMSSL